MNLQLRPEDLAGLPRFTRANLVNSLSGFKSLSLIATADPQGRFNLAPFSNIVHLGADPALIAFVNRPREAAPHTLANIEATRFYTVNHVHEALLSRAHQCSAKYPAGQSEFEATGLTPELAEGYTVPYVQESRVKYLLELVEVLPIPHNHTFLVIGALRHLVVPAGILSEDGFLHLEQAGSCCSLGLDAYYQTTLLQRLPYARP